MSSEIDTRRSRVFLLLFFLAIGIGFLVGGADTLGDLAHKESFSKPKELVGYLIAILGFPLIGASSSLAAFCLLLSPYRIGLRDDGLVEMACLFGTIRFYAYEVGTIKRGSGLQLLRGGRTQRLPELLQFGWLPLPNGPEGEEFIARLRAFNPNIEVIDGDNRPQET